MMLRNPLNRKLIVLEFSMVKKQCHQNVAARFEFERRIASNRDTVKAKIRTGTDQLDRGEEIPDDQLDAQLAKLRRPS